MRSACVTPAIVLRSWPYGESDKIVSFLTQTHGKVTGIAKGAKRSRKRFVNTLEPFSLVNLRFQDRPHSSLVFVYGCDPLRPFKDITTSLEKIVYASYFVEITDRLVGERDENRKLFEHLREGLIFIEENGPSLSLLIFFELKLLQFSGYQPILEHCRRCGKNCQASTERQWRFSARDGGILCGPCSIFRKEAVPLSIETLAALSELQQAKSILPRHLSFSPAVLKESRPVLERFIQFHINKELKSAPFLDAFTFS